MLGESDRSEAVRTAGQQSDDDVHKRDPVGKIRSGKVKVHRHRDYHAHDMYIVLNQGFPSSNPPNTAPEFLKDK